MTSGDCLESPVPSFCSYTHPAPSGRRPTCKRSIGGVIAIVSRLSLRSCRSRRTVDKSGRRHFSQMAWINKRPTTSITAQVTSSPPSSRPPTHGSLAASPSQSQQSELSRMSVQRLTLVPMYRFPKCGKAQTSTCVILSGAEGSAFQESRNKRGECVGCQLQTWLSWKCPLGSIVARKFAQLVIL